MIDAIQNLVRSTDAAIARAYLSVFRERNALLCFLFHSMFNSEREMDQNLIDPLDRTTVDKFRQLIKYYLRYGYQFVSLQDVINGLPPDGRYAMLTFDDGYYNNRLALPVLEELKVPALFFISTNNVRDNKCFWWDVLYRERAAQGAKGRQIYHDAMALKSLRTSEIEAELKRRFGNDALQPRCDIDRPFTPAELRQFAMHPRVTLGNHTADHAILTNYTQDEVRLQIAEAQTALREMAGVESTSIAYPNGGYTDEIVELAEEVGLQVGFTIRPEKVPLPLARSRMMRLGRFVPHAKGAIDAQCRTYRSDVLLYKTFRGGYLKLVGAER